MSARRRSELELFRGLETENPEDVAELSSRLRRCVHWVLNNRLQGGHALVGQADDIVGEALVRLEGLRARGFQGGPLEFKTYFYKVVASACFAAARSHWLLESLDAPVTLPDGEEKTLGDVLDGMIAPDRSPEATLEAAEQERRVRRALESLDERCRELLRRFYLEDTSIREVAKAEGKRANAIEVALMRCRNRLYAAFLANYLANPDPEFKARVARAAEALAGLPGRVFRAWWTDNRSAADVGKEIGMSPGETRQLLARAKFEVWRVVAEDGAP